MNFGEFIGAADDDAGELTAFIDPLVDDPGLFFELSNDERTQGEWRFDNALALCRDTITLQSK
jgi:hypothetical protein